MLSLNWKRGTCSKTYMDTDGSLESGVSSDFLLRLSRLPCYPAGDSLCRGPRAGGPAKRVQSLALQACPGNPALGGELWMANREPGYRWARGQRGYLYVYVSLPLRDAGATGLAGVLCPGGSTPLLQQGEPDTHHSVKHPAG